MITDAVDDVGRRYLEVDIFPEGALKRAFERSEPETCVECGRSIRHAFDRYFQRNEASDGRGLSVEAALMALTFDAVCGECGDTAIRSASR